MSNKVTMSNKVSELIKFGIHDVASAGADYGGTEPIQFTYIHDLISLSNMINQFQQMTSAIECY